MKKFLKWFLIVFIVLIIIGMIFGKGKGNNGQTTINDIAENQDVDKSKLTENEKEIVNILIDDDFKTLESGGDSFISGFYPMYTAEKIGKDYESNEVRANNLYKDKEFFVTGRIKNIDASIGDRPVVYLKTASNYGINPPTLQFKRNEDGKVAELNKDEKVTFFCKGKTVILGSPILGNCEFLDSVKQKARENVNEFKDADLSGSNKGLDKYSLFLISSTQLLSRASNDFEKCKKLDANCATSIFKAEASRDGFKKRLEDNISTQYPKAAASLKDKSESK